MNIELRAEGTAARVVSDYVVHWCNKNDFAGIQNSEGGYSRWKLRRDPEDGMWYIAKVRFEVKWTTVPESEQPEDDLEPGQERFQNDHVRPGSMQGGAPLGHIPEELT